MRPGIFTIILLFCTLSLAAQEFEFLREVPASSNSILQEPLGMAVNSNSEVYISDGLSKGILKYDERGNQIEIIKKLQTSGGTIDLIEPEHLYVDANDKLFVYDKGLGKIAVIPSNGKAFVFGEKGSQLGQIDDVIGLVADDQGYVYVLNEGKKRVDIFQPDGTYLTWITGGFDPFKNPVSISINGRNEICVLDATGPSIIMFDVYGNQVNMHRKFTKWEGVAIEEPVSIAAFGNGDFLVLDGESSRVTKFSRSGEILGTFGSKGNASGASFLNATKIMSCGSKDELLLVMDEGAKTVSLFEISFHTPRTPPVVKRMKVQHKSSGRQSMQDLLVNSEGQQYAIPENNHQLVVAFQDSTNKQKFAIDGGFKDAVALGLDQEDNVYVVDRQAKEIQVFTKEGVLIRKLGKDMPEKLKSPNSIAIQKNGNVVVCDNSTGSVHMWNSTGIYQKKLISSDNSALLGPEKIQIDSKDRIYIWDEKANCIYRTGSNGWPLELISLKARPERVDDNAGKISDFFIDPLDQIFILNATTNQIEVYFWDVDPELRFSIGNPGDGPNGLNKVEKLVFDRDNYLVYGVKKGGAEQKVLQFLVKPPAPDNAISFNAADGNLLVVYNKSNSKMVTGYGLVSKGENGQDSVFSRSNSTILTLDESNIQDLKLHHYDFVSLSKSDFSDPSVSFDNYLGYANRLKDAEMYDEARIAYERTIAEFGAFGGLLTTVSGTLSSTSKYLAENAEVGRAKDYFKSAFAIAPHDKEVWKNGKTALYSYYRELAYRGDASDIITEVDDIPKRESYRKLAMNAVDSVCMTLNLESNVHSLATAIKLGKAIHNWEPSSTEYTYTLAKNHYKLFQLKELYGVPALELEALLNSGAKYAEHAVNGLKLNEKNYFNQEILQLKILNASSRYDHAELIAVSGLSDNLSAMNQSTVLAYRIELAEAYKQQLKYNEAALELNRILEVDTENSNALNSLAELRLDNREPEEAQRLYRKLLMKDAENAVYAAQIGKIELLKGNFAEASFQLEKALSQDPSNHSFYGPLAEAYDGAKNFRKAKENYQIAVIYQEELLDQSSRRICSFQEKTALKNRLNNYLEKLAGLHNQLGNYESARDAYARIIETTPNSADAFFGLGQASLKSGRIYDGIAAFESASRLDPSNQNYTNEFQKALRLRNQVAANEEALSIVELKMNEIFPSLIKNYADQGLLPIGQLIIANNSKLPITPTLISVYAKELMDAPSQIKPPSIVSLSNSTIDLAALFGDQILSFTEDQNLQLEVVVEYSINGKSKKASKSASFVLHGRNAIVWSDKRRLAAFVAPSVSTFVEYDKKSDLIFKDSPSYGLNRSILQAMQTYTVLHDAKYVYSPDPIQSYAMVSSHPELLDYLQYPAETMKRKSGDCDDLVTLYSSLLENAGVPTAYIDVPGHVLMAFDSGVNSEQLESSGFNENEVIVYRNTIWIPIETTLIDKHGFMTAWKRGAERYYTALSREQFPELVPMSDARQIYSPSFYIPDGFEAKLESSQELMSAYNAQLEELLAKMNQAAIKTLESRYQTEPGNTFVKNKYASFLAKIGELDKAERILLEARDISPENPIVLNNLGNIMLIQGNSNRAIEYYSNAAAIDAVDGEILINLCKAYLLKGDKSQAINSFDKAIALDSELNYLYDELKIQLR